VAASVITFVGARAPIPHDTVVQWVGGTTAVLEVRSRSEKAIDVVAGGEASAVQNRVEKHAGARLDALKIDRIYQPALLRSKRLFITDMDSTIIRCECIDEMAAEMGLKEKVAAITRSAMEGGLDFRRALRERVAMLRGMSVTQLESVFAARVRLSSGADTLMDALKRNGIQTVLVSGGFTFFAERIARQLGFDFYYANELEIIDEALTGKVTGPVVTKEVKLRLLQYHANALSIGRDEVIALGDGANDLPMLKEAGLGIAYRAKPVVEENIANRIRFTDLETVANAIDQ
jgi:phosphoserine phosphatase